MAVEKKNGENMAKSPKTRHFIPVIIIPSKVAIKVTINETYKSPLPLNQGY